MCVWLVWPAQSFGRALVRFVHGVPGVARATLGIQDASGSQNFGTMGFAQSTAWHSIRSGRFHWTLTGSGKTLATGVATVGSGAYDIILLEQQMKVWLGIYRARGATAGASLVRVIHGAPELGAPELTVDGKQAVKSLAYRQDTPYVRLTPGAHTLAALRPGTRTPVLGGVHINVKSGVAYSAVVLGTRGERVRVVTLVDRGAPLVSRSPARTTRVSDQISTKAGAVVVRSGDSLWSIAHRLVGPHASGEAIHRKLVAIWELNRIRIGTGDPNLIFPGTRLRLPSPQGSSAR